MKKKNKVLALALAGLILGMIGISFSFLTEQSRIARAQSVNFEGKTIRAHTVHFGTNHTFALRPAWKENLLAAIPKSWHRHVPFLTQGLRSQFSGNEASSLVWISIVGKGASETPLDRVEVVDEHGCRFSSGFSSTHSSENEVLHGFDFNAFPWRSKEVLFHMYQSETNKTVVLRITPPPFTNIVELDPQSLPISRTNGTLVFTLKKLLGFTTQERNDYVEPFFEVHENSQLSPDWPHPQITYYDAFGNHGSTLCFHEPAWKIEVLAYRRPLATFTTNEMFSLGSFVIPPPVTQLAMTNTFNISNSFLNLHSFLGSGSYTISNNVLVASEPWDQEGGRNGISMSGPTTIMTLTRNRPFVLIKGSIHSPKQRISMLAIDESGQSIPLLNEGSVNDVQYHVFPLPLPSGKVELKLIVQFAREFEFVVQPPKLDVSKSSR